MFGLAKSLNLFHWAYATHWDLNPSSMQDVCPMNEPSLMALEHPN